MIFGRFVQADMSTTRAYQRVGLGLCMTRKVIEAHGGTIKVDSTLGKGSTFYVDIPMRSSEMVA